MRKLIYIMGPSYSGSTLLTLLLADHPDIATVGELKATSMGDVSTYSCSCGELLTACPFWQNVQQMMREQGRSFSLDDYKTHFQYPQHPLINRLFRAAFRNPVFEIAREMGFLLSPAARKIRAQILAQNKALIEIICSLQHAPMFLDDSKDPIRLKLLLAADIWNIRTIQLIRDGRGVTNSYMHHHKTTMDKAAREWLHTQKECDRMARLLGSTRCLTVHYENLCLGPEKTLEDIYRFLDLQLENIAPSSRIKHILGNQMRLGSLQDIRLDEKWRQALSGTDVQIFNEIAGELNRRHGYK